MTDAGEKLLRDRVRKVVQRVHLPQFVNEIAETAEGLVRAELERAAGIADRLDQVEGGRIASAIRKLKE